MNQNLRKHKIPSLLLIILTLTFTLLTACGDTTSSGAATTKNSGNSAVAANLPTLAPTNNTTKNTTTQANTTQATSKTEVVNQTTTKVQASNPTTPQITTAVAATPTPAKPSTPASPITPLPWAGRGILQDQNFYSPILNRNVTYRIYLPPGYNGDSKRYPVLYMLHGLSGSYKEWTDYGLLNYSDDMIGAGTVQPFIIVLPEGDQDYWLNWANGGLRWADYVVTDVVGHIDATYRTIPDAAHRAIGGISMGGHGSLQIGLNHPETFSIIGSHSATLRTKDQAYFYWGDDNYYATIDPVSLAKVKNLSGYKFFIDIGIDDTEWKPRVEELVGILKSRDANVTFNEWPGTHGGEYWIAHVKEYIKFYANSFPNSGTASSGN